MKYICSLYSLNAKTDSKQDILTRQTRYNYTLKKAAELLNQGVNAYSPILHCHEMSVKCKLPKEYTFWKNIDHHMIDLSDSVLVLMMKDEYGSWVESEGILDEIRYSISIGKSVEFLECETY